MNLRVCRSSPFSLFVFFQRPSSLRASLIIYETKAGAFLFLPGGCGGGLGGGGLPLLTMRLWGGGGGGEGEAEGVWFGWLWGCVGVFFFFGRLWFFSGP